MKDRLVQDKKYHCEICGRNFARLEHLKRHTTTHTNEKSFRCFCGKAFARRDLLKRHEEIGKHLATNLALRVNSAPNVTPILAAPTPPTTAEYTPPDSSGHSNESPLNDPGYGGDVHMNTFLSFDAFLNTMGLNAPLDSIFPDLLSGPDPNFGVDESSQMSSTARLPYLPPDAHAEDIHELKRIPCAWKVTTGQWEDLRSAIKPYDKQMNGFVLPSLLAISRHITGYFEDFHNHLQILHPVTYRPQDCPESPELTLAVAAVGAICRYETNTAVRMFDAAMSIVHARLREYGSRFSAAPLNHAVTDVDPRSWSALRTVQAALLLTAFAVMEGKSHTSHDAASLQCLLVDYATSDEHGGAPGIPQPTWKQWTFLESVRRTRCAIFNVLNLYTTVLDSPAALPSSRLNTYLPCSTLEWTAQNEDNWRLAQNLAPEPQGFQEAYSDLLTAAAPQTALYSPFGNLVLINALLQRIHLARQMQLNGRSESLRSSDLDEINIALERWTHAWRQAPESIFDPRNPDASNSFTATSLLGLAFVRLHTTYASCRALREWQPHKTGLNLARAHNPKRDADIIAALLHATQAFAVPVKFGVEVTSRRQLHHWNLQNFVWHLEAATFLSKWLLSVAEPCDKDPVSDFECRLMSIIHSLVNKAEESLGWSTIPEPGKAVAHRTTATLASDLSDRLARIWSRLYKRHNSPWALTELIGESLEEYQKAMARL